MIRKSYLFLGASITAYLLLLYILPLIPYNNLSYYLFLDSLFLYVPSLILNIFGIYYGVKGVRKYNGGAKGIWAIILNIIVIVYFILWFSFSILIAFMFFFGIPL